MSPIAKSQTAYRATKKYREKHALLGLCKMCPNKLGSKKGFCDSCRLNINAKYRLKYKKRRANGLCSYCKNKTVINTSLCFIHTKKKFVKTKTYMLSFALKEIFHGINKLSIEQIHYAVNEIKKNSSEFERILSSRNKKIFTARVLTWPPLTIRSIHRNIGYSYRQFRKIERKIVQDYVNYLEKNSSSIKQNQTGLHISSNPQLSG